MEIYHPRDDELLREMRRVRRSARKKRLMWGFAVWMALSVAAGIFVFNRLFMLSVMHGPAMGGNLPSGSLVLVRRAEEGDRYAAGDVLLYEKRSAVPVELTILSPKGKIRNYCQYRLYRDMGTTRQYMARKDGHVTWVSKSDEADVMETDPEGLLTLDTEGLPNGDYFLKETYASYGQDVLLEPVPITVHNPTLTQMKRVLGAPGDNLVLSPYQETRVNGHPISRFYTSGRTEDASVEARRVNVPEKEYFVQGDQLSLSVDSRDREFETIPADEVLGRAEFVIWPIGCFGSPALSAETPAGAEQGGAE